MGKKLLENLSFLLLIAIVLSVNFSQSFVNPEVVNTKLFLSVALVYLVKWNAEKHYDLFWSCFSCVSVSEADDHGFCQIEKTNSFSIACEFVKNSNVFKHLRESKACSDACSKECFTIIDSASTKFSLKIKEALHINWIKPSLNQQVKHANLKLCC